MQKSPLPGHQWSVPFEVPHIDMCTFILSTIRTPPYTGQLTLVPMVSLLWRVHCIHVYYIVWYVRVCT